LSTAAAAAVEASASMAMMSEEAAIKYVIVFEMR
jgi:hypothetical protein